MCVACVAPNSDQSKLSSDPTHTPVNLSGCGGSNTLFNRRRRLTGDGARRTQVEAIDDGCCFMSEPIKVFWQPH